MSGKREAAQENERTDPNGSTKKGIVLLLENCDGWASLTPDNLRHLSRRDRRPLPFRWSSTPGTPLLTALPPQSVWDFYHHARSRIAHVHIKDCYRDGEEKTIHCYPSEGECEVLPIVRDLGDYPGTQACIR